MKKEREAKYKEEIKARNSEILRQQKNSGGPSLRERELMKKEAEDRALKEAEKAKRAELREKRLTEDRAVYGLDLIDHKKLREFQECKLEQQMLEEAVKR